MVATLRLSLPLVESVSERKSPASVVHGMPRPLPRGRCVRLRYAPRAALLGPEAMLVLIREAYSSLP